MKKPKAAKADTRQADAFTHEDLMQRAQWMLRDGYSQYEIAKSIDITADAVRALLDEALERLQRETTWLAKYDGILRESRIDACLAKVMPLLSHQQIPVVLAASKEIRELERARMEIRLGTERVKAIVKGLGGDMPEGIQLVIS
jgi:transposase